MTYQTEFPDFEDMPADVPADWIDSSWHNDACPSFQFMVSGKGDSNFEFARVWIAESNPAEREYPESKRFLITFENGSLDCLDVLATDSWAEVLTYITPRVMIAARYTETVGYNPFLDDPNSDPAEIAESLYVTRRLFKMESAQ